MWRLFVALLLIVCAANRAWGDTSLHAIGVLTREGENDTAARWGPTAAYLAARLPGDAFVIVPLHQRELTKAMGRREAEFAITDAGHYVRLEAQLGAAAIATLQHPYRDTAHSTAGAAIIVRADRPDIVWMSDLHGKSFMAVARDSFAGFQLAWWELISHDIDPFSDFSRLVFSGPPAEQVVEAVRDGAIDAAAVRTDVLERMVEQGAIDARALRVLHPRATAQHPVARSTDLYPEWAFVAGPGAPDELARRVAGALRSMPADHVAARAGRYAGWAAPLDYHPVHELLRDLGLPPYEDVGRMTIAEFAQRRWQWLTVALGVVLAMAAMLAYMSRLNYRLAASRAALERARRAEAEIAHVGRLAAMGVMSTTLAHELNQPLAAIVNYANGSIRRLRAGGLDAGDLQNVLERIASEGTRSAEIIRRIREFLRKRKPLHAPEDANRIVREAVDLVRPTSHSRGVGVRLALAEALPPVIVDAVQIEQVVVNLVHNAIEAIDNSDSPRREVIVATERNAPRGVSVTVRDTGPGVPAEVAVRLFEPFVSTKPEGMGLGLSISQSIVEAHGDHLRAVPNPGGGAAFRFTLPETEAMS